MVAAHSQALLLSVATRGMFIYPTIRAAASMQKAFAINPWHSLVC